MRNANYYAQDLAYVHDQGFDFLSRAAAPFLIDRLQRRGCKTGTVVSFGCGSGIAESIVQAAGYDVVGFDQSAPMLQIARRRCPSLKLHRQSFVDAELPDCVAAYAFGEVFNYQFDPRSNRRALRKFFRGVWRALTPGGLLAFDVAEPERSQPPQDRHRNFLGKDWALCLDVTKSDDNRQLTRHMTLFRKVGRGYRRSEENHTLNLYPASELVDLLRATGFTARTHRSYGNMKPLRGLRVITAHKPK